MSPVEFLRTRPLVAALALGALFGSAMGVLRSIAPPPAHETGGELDWALPPAGVVNRFDETRFSRVRDLRIWGAAGATTDARIGADGKPLVPNWRLTGIILEPEPLALVLADGASTVTRIAVGGSLPDDGRVLAVSAAGIEYERDGCRRQRMLYSGDAGARVDACMPGADPSGAVLPSHDPGATPMPTSDSPSGPTSSE